MILAFNSGTPNTFHNVFAEEDEKQEQIKNPRKLRTRLMFCDLLDEEL